MRLERTGWVGGAKLVAHVLQLLHPTHRRNDPRNVISPVKNQGQV